jgi:hypothetical protein
MQGNMNGDKEQSREIVPAATKGMHHLVAACGTFPVNMNPDLVLTCGGGMQQLIRP